MNGLQQYEAWLDQLDTQLTIRCSAIVLDMGDGLRMPLAECRSAEGIIRQGKLLLTTLVHEFAALPEKYLVGRYVRLACQANRLDLDQEALVSEIIKTVAACESLQR